MAKPKIDLKARLGRRATAAQAPAAGGSIPPPVSMGAMPSAAPSPGSPFASAPPSAGSVPAGRASYDPMAGVAPVVAAPAPAALPGASAPFEMDEDFAAAQRGGGAKKMIAVALGAGLVCFGLGWAGGSGSENSKVAEKAVAGAKALDQDVTAANAEIDKMSEALTAARTALFKDGKYPSEQVKVLGGLDIPFDGTNLTNRGIGRFQPRLTTMLISYASSVSKANAQKDKLRRLLSFAEKPVTQMLAERENPTVKWGVYVQNGPKGAWGNMTRIPPFEQNSSWPRSFELTEGKQTFELPRYTGGDPMASKRRGRSRPAELIPIAPASQAAVCSTDTIVKLRSAINEMKSALDGDQTPGRETQGLKELGAAIQKELAKIGAQKS